MKVGRAPRRLDRRFWRRNGHIVARLRAEAAALRDDPEDVAASRALTAEMDAIRAW